MEKDKIPIVLVLPSPVPGLCSIHLVVIQDGKESFGKCFSSGVVGMQHECLWWNNFSFISVLSNLPAFIDIHENFVSS